jgi:hypothetical protein
MWKANGNTTTLLLFLNSLFQKTKGKGKVHPRTGHEGKEGECRGISLLFL